MSISGDQKQEAHENGQHAYNYGKDDLLGPSRHEPWRDLCESSEDYDERLDAHNKGFDNARDSHRGK